MKGVNKVILLGRLGQDPELKTFANGGKVANFSLATSEKWKDKATGAAMEHTSWHPIEMNNRLAEVAAQYLKKGDVIYIEGKNKYDKYEKNGEKRTAQKVLVITMEMISTGDKQPQQQNAYANTQNGSNYQPPQQTPNHSDIPPDDLPF